MMNENENARARKIARDEGLKETKSGGMKNDKNVIHFSKTGGSGTCNGSFFNTVHELKKKIKK